MVTANITFPISGGKMQDLTTLIQSGSSCEIASIGTVDINDAGQIAGGRNLQRPSGHAVFVSIPSITHSYSNPSMLTEAAFSKIRGERFR